MKVIYQSFHIIDIENEISFRKEIPEDFNGFVQDLIDFSNQNDKTKLYCVIREESLLVDCIKRMIKDFDEDYVNELSNTIAKHLVDCEKLAQAKIYQMGSNVKKGSLVQALIEKDEDEYEYILAKVEHSEYYDGESLNKNYGFSSDKKNIWKSAVFSLYTINGQVFFNDVKVYIDTKAKYWTTSFLEVEEKRDDCFNTYHAYRAIDNELKSTLKENSPRDYVVLSNEIQNTLNKPQEFHYSNYVEELIDNYKPSNEEIDKDIIKDCLLALPERKKFDTEFKVAPQSIENKRTKKYIIAQGIELMIKSTSCDFSKRIISTIKDGKRVLEIVCDDNETYEAFIEENE